jgi:hypothetical protein
LLLRRHGLKAIASEQVAKIEWPVPPDTVARGGFHTAELNVAGEKQPGAPSTDRIRGGAGRRPDIFGHRLGIRAGQISVKLLIYRGFWVALLVGRLL